MDNDCPHLIPDANDKCIDCGADMPPINLPPNYEPNLGDVMALCKLLDETRKSFDKVIVANTDPKNPKLPRMRMVGGTLMRLEHKLVIRGLVGPTFLKAKSLGYRGTEKRWREMIFEDIPTLTSPHTSPPTSFCGIME